MSVPDTVIGLSAVAAAVSVVATARARRAAGGDPRAVVLFSGVLLALVLLFIDRHAVLSWSFGVGVGETRVLLPGVGVLLGVGLLAATGGALLLGANLAAPSAGGAGTAAKGTLWAAAAAAASGVGLAGVRLLAVTGEPREAAIWPLALVAASTAGLALSLVSASGSPAPDAEREAARAAVALHVAVALAFVAATAAGVEGWWREGTYATGLTAAAAAIALVGLAAREPLPRFALALRVLFLVGLLALLR